MRKLYAWQDGRWIELTWDKFPGVSLYEVREWCRTMGIATARVKWPKTVFGVLEAYGGLLGEKKAEGFGRRV